MELTIALIGVISALLGTALGGVISYLTTKSAKSMEWRFKMLSDEIQERKDLYSCFLEEVNGLVFSSFHEKHSDLRKFSNLGNLLAKMELSSSDEVIIKAKNVSDYAFMCHAATEKQPENDFAELRQEFVNTAKNEIIELKTHNYSLNKDAAVNRVAC